MSDVLIGIALSLVAACVLALLVFIVRYLRTGWRGSPEGRHMMTFSIVLFVILGTTLSAALWRATGILWLVIQVVEFAALLAVLIGQDVLLFRAQRRKHGKQEDRRQGGGRRRGDPR